MGRLYMVDPVGSCYGYQAISTGNKEQEGMSALEKMTKEHREKNKDDAKEKEKSGSNALNLNERETVEFAIEALQKVLGVDFKSNQVEVAVCSKKNTKFRTLPEKQIDEYLTAISEKD